MFQTKVYKKVEWLKNQTEQGGAQDEVISKFKDGDVLLHIHQKDLGRLWGSTTPDNVIKLINKNIGLYEVLHRFPLKVYFDIDKTDNLGSNDLDIYKQIILKYIPDADMAISGSETDEKHSYHIVLNNYSIKNEIERENFKQFVKETLFKEDGGFDWKVYTKNRNMKCINQSKPEKPIQEIIECSDVKKHLISCFVDHNSKSVILPEIKVKVDNPRVNILSLPDLPYQSVDALNLSYSELFIPINILKMLPINKDFDHKYTWLVARFCFYNDIKFDDFWNWYKNKNGHIDAYTKWQIQWTKLHEHPEVSIHKMRLVLEKYYPDIYIGKELKEFVSLCDISKEPFEEIETLDQCHFYRETKSIIFNIGMGGGKTTQTIDYLRKECQGDGDKSFIWMTPNIALASNTYGRMKFINTSLYNTEKKAEKKREMIETSENLMICMNSLKYVTKKYNIVVIDEIETFLKKWCFNSTLTGVQTICYDNFLRTIKEADHIILLDAFITNITIKFFQDLNISYTIIKRKNDKSYNNRDAIKYMDKDDLTKDIVKNLRLNKKLCIFYPYCKGNQNNLSMNDFKALLEQNTGKKGIAHNSESSDKTKLKLQDVNSSWIKYDFVVSNNVITVGVNFDVSYFDQVYVYIAPFNEMRDIVQFTYRSRKLNDNIIKFCFLPSYFHQDDFDKLDKLSTIKSNEYINLRNNVLIEQTTPIVETFQYFLNMAGYNILPSLNEIVNRDIEVLKLIKSSDIYYDYKSIDTIPDELLKDYEKDFYSQNCGFKTKIILRKYHFDKKFHDKLDDNVKEEIWNNNYIQLVDDVIRVISGRDVLMDKLKNDYKWEMHFPDNMNNFKFDEVSLKTIFNSGFCSRKLSTESNHQLILKSFINHYYNEPVIKSKVDDNHRIKYEINDKFKRIYIMIKDSVKRPENNNEDCDFVDDR